MSDDNFQILHGLTFDRAKRKFRLRLTIHRGRKVVGKRLCVWVRTDDETVAMIARDAALQLCGALGLKCAHRFQRRKSGDERREG